MMSRNSSSCWRRVASTRLWTVSPASYAYRAVPSEVVGRRAASSRSSSSRMSRRSAASSTTGTSPEGEPPVADSASVDALAFAFFFGMAFCWTRLTGSSPDGEPPVGSEESAAADGVSSSKEELTPAARCFSSCLSHQGPAREAACSET